MSACKNVYGSLNGSACSRRKINKRVLNNYQKMQDASHFMLFKRNLTVLKQTPNQSSNTAVGGNGDSVTSVQKYKNGRQRKGVDKKHGSYARYLAAKTARAGHCPLTSANKTTYTAKIAATAAPSKCVEVKKYMDFLQHYRCHTDIQSQVDILNDNSC